MEEKEIIKSKKKKGKFREFAESILIALVIALVLRAFVVQAFKIPTGSMQPTLHGAMDYGTGDKILVNKFIYKWVREPKRGDIVVFSTSGIEELYEEPNKNPWNAIRLLLGWDGSRDFIKRLIGLPGDKVLIKEGQIFVNGERLAEPEIFTKIHYENRGPFGEVGKEIIVPEESYFVLGDNSSNSKDSRYWGFVPKKNVKGTAFCIYWPPSRIGTVE